MNVYWPKPERPAALALRAKQRIFTPGAGCEQSSAPPWNMSLLEQLNRDRLRGQRRFAVLVDPDQSDARSCARIGEMAAANGVDFLLVGGSLVVEDRLEESIKALKRASGLPVILFPGSIQQISPAADAILLLSLISGRNPELLIGQHVQAAPHLRRSGLEILPTGYLLVDGGAPTTVSYISNTLPIPRDKGDIAAATALAGEQLGLRIAYLDAGSGARVAVPPKMIRAVRQTVDLPIIVGGGIRTPEAAAAAAEAGADLVVVGNALEENPELLRELSLAVHTAAIRPEGASKTADPESGGGLRSEIH